MVRPLDKVQPKLGIVALGEHLILVNAPIQGPYLPHTNPLITPQSHQIINRVLKLHKD
jgi:hypothetical protein